MAKTSKKVRHARQQKLIAKYATKRAELKEILSGKAQSVEEYNAAKKALAAIPRDANPNRLRNRCLITGKPRGYYRDFGLCRNQLRKLAHEGALPGVVKSSW